MIPALLNSSSSELKYSLHYADGTRLCDRQGDEPQFDPGVLTEGTKTYLYTGFSWPHDKTPHGSMVTVLAQDMLTIVEEPRYEP
jgi:arabinoxylan arabinofuranohydrolase